MSSTNGYGRSHARAGCGASDPKEYISMVYRGTDGRPEAVLEAFDGGEYDQDTCWMWIPVEAFVKVEP